MCVSSLIFIDVIGVYCYGLLLHLFAGVPDVARGGEPLAASRQLRGYFAAQRSLCDPRDRHLASGGAHAQALGRDGP
jgi:hypothetical protein